MYLIVMRDKKGLFSLVKFVTYLEGGATSAAVDLEVGGDNIIACA